MVEHTENVKVIVRIRPVNGKEKNSVKAIVGNPEKGQIVAQGGERNHNINCGYDRVFDETASQMDVYKAMEDSVLQVVQGFNCTIFAYGQTGTGKTHTMLGKDLENELHHLLHAPTENWGVIPRSVESLFQEIHEIGKTGSSAVVHCSYMQIYNNEVYDLLQESKSAMKEPLTIREIIKGNARHIYVSKISEFRVACGQDVLQLLQKGGKNRKIRATECNEQSSRSHAVLQISVEIESRGTECATIIRRAKLNLVDLAGSEKWDTEVNMGQDRTRELTNINRSLSALGNVISALSDSRRTHIPYRDSKLTRLLQDSLGGNTRTIVLATISPSLNFVDESVSTLQFADRAKKVMVRVKVNELVDDAILLARAQREIARLKVMLKKKNSEQVEALEEKLENLNKKNSRLRSENVKLQQKVDKLDKKCAKMKLMKTSGTLRPPKELNRKKSEASFSDILEDDDFLDDKDFDLKDLQNELRPTRQENIDKNLPLINGLPRSPKEILGHEYIEKQNTAMNEIQNERRQLERELERLNNSEHPENNNSDDEVCPICSRIIDEHTDAQLDDCIDREAETFGKNPKFERIEDFLFNNDIEEKEKLEEMSGKQLKSSMNISHHSLNHASEHTQHEGNKTIEIGKIKKGLIKKKKKKKVPKSKSKEILDTFSNQVENLPKIVLSNSVEDIGLHISVYKYRYDSWYPCIIVGFDSKRHMHCCQFDYGDKQWQDLNKAKHRVIGRRDESDTTSVKGPRMPQDGAQKITPNSKRRLSSAKSAYSVN